MPLFEHRYGIVLDIEEPLDDLNLELYCFASERKSETQRLPKWQHFRNITQILWGEKSNKPFIWHPWAERMLEESCNEKYLAVLGCASAGKTDFYAIWAIVNWLASPLNTKVMVTSTSLKESKKRIWGSIREYFTAVQGLPGRLVDSHGIIKTVDDKGVVASEKSGIELIPGEKKKEKEAIGKMIGIKNQRMFMIADEMPELSEAILSASVSNLDRNPRFQFVGIGNFSSIYDALGEFAKPVDGYETINPDMLEWETVYGKCIRFDAIKSPNILNGRDEWPFIFNNKDLATMRKTLGEDSPLFWRMCRSYPCPESVESVIYTEADLLKGKVHEKPVWLSSVTKIAFIDPAFTSQGDRSIAAVMAIGLTTNGNYVIHIDKLVDIKINVNKKDVPEVHQVAMEFIQLCKREGVKPFHAGYDSSSGGGITFGEILNVHWSDKLYALAFGGKASGEKVSLSDERTAEQQYGNKVTEVWYSGVAYMQNGQLKGVTTDLARELKSRKYVTFKNNGIKVVAESKKDMKKRTGFSPDMADAVLGGIMLARDRLKFLPGEAKRVINGQIIDKPKEEDLVQQVFENIDYSEQGMDEYLTYAETH